MSKDGGDVTIALRQWQVDELRGIVIDYLEAFEDDLREETKDTIYTIMIQTEDAS